MNRVEQLHVQTKFVPAEILERLSLPHSKEVHGCPMSWMASYHGKDARQNIRYFENAVRICKLEFPIRVWFSTWTDNIVVGFVPLESIKEPHIQEWHLTFYEVLVEEAKERLDKYPEYPYDGRNRDLVRAELWASGETPQGITKKSREHLKKLGVELESKF